MSANTSSPSPRLRDLFIQFLWIGSISFGGGIVAYERILIVDKKQWLTPDQFMAFLSISQTMPGLNSVNLAVLTGDYLAGIRGSLACAIGLMLPGAVFVLSLGALYTYLSSFSVTTFMLSGIAAGATGLLGAITYRMGEDLWKKITPILIVASTFVLMSIFKLSLLMVLLIMAPISLYIYRPKKTS